MKKDLFKILLAFALLIIASCIPFKISYINILIYIVSYIIVGLEVVLKAAKNIIKGKVFDENFLMTVATIGAFCIGEFPEAVAVMLFYQIGELFQDYAVDKSKKSIADLMNIKPDFANLKTNELITTVSPEKVKVGETIIVKPGEKIPLDGIILEGSSMLNTSALTGESVPVEVQEGDTVLSGSINQTGLLTIKVTKVFGESTVSKILELVQNASNRKAKSENFITKFAKIYTPVVVIIAVLLAIVPPLILGKETFSSFLYKALSFLVVSCPCALVISIPLGFFGGIGGASKKGILVKGGNYLEALANLNIVVLDKTGTLTEGVFEVQDIQAFDISKEDLIKLVAHAEHYSNHPISKSLKNAYNNEIQEGLISETHELAGLGIEAVVDKKIILVGNEKLMQQRNINYVANDGIGTVIYVAINEKFAGSILIADKIKKDAKLSIQKLKKQNIKKIVMLTGDKKEVAENVANKLGIDEVYSQLLPNEKVQKVEELLRKKGKNGKLAFIGDGINDSPALAVADIGIAMGALGSDAAIEASDVVIMTDEPSKIEEAIKIAKKTMMVVKENIAFAIGVKIVILILTAMGISNMWQAVFADVGVSILAVLNALRVSVVGNLNFEKREKK